MQNDYIYIIALKFLLLCLLVKFLVEYRGYVMKILKTMKVSFTPFSYNRWIISDVYNKAKNFNFILSCFRGHTEYENINREKLCFTNSDEDADPHIPRKRSHCFYRRSSQRYLRKINNQEFQKKQTLASIRLVLYTGIIFPSNKQFFKICSEAVTLVKTTSATSSTTTPLSDSFSR